MQMSLRAQRQAPSRVHVNVSKKKKKRRLVKNKNFLEFSSGAVTAAAARVDAVVWVCSLAQELLHAAEAAKKRKNKQEPKYFKT